MPKFLGAYVLAVAIFCGFAFEGRSALTPSRAPAAPSSIGGPAEVHYAPAEDLESIDVALIGEAEKQIDMAAYVLTDRAVIQGLREAAARGVRVRIWRDASMAAKVGDYDVEAQLGGRVQGLEIRSNAPGDELMHLKGYCVDHRLLRTGSANFSRSGETRQDNDLVALRGQSVCAGFDAKFDGAWGSGLRNGSRAARPRSLVASGWQCEKGARLSECTTREGWAVSLADAQRSDAQSL